MVENFIKTLNFTNNKQTELGEISEESCIDKAFEEMQKYFDAIVGIGI